MYGMGWALIRVMYPPPSRCASPVMVYAQDLSSHLQQLFAQPQQRPLPVLYGGLCVLSHLAPSSFTDLLFPHLESLVAFLNSSLKSISKEELFRLQEAILVREGDVYLLINAHLTLWSHSRVQ